MSRYTGMVRKGWEERSYDVIAASRNEARALIAARASADVSAVRGLCRVLANYGDNS